VSSRRGRAWVRMAAVGVAVVACDQAAKVAVTETMSPGERTDLILGFDLARVENSGIAFGLLQDSSDLLVLAITAAALVLVLGWFALDSARPGLWLGVGLLAGGAIGNLIDRLRLDAVTDFIDPPMWPAFNLADVAITLGVVAIALAALFEPREPEASPS
jgi:signal peptidase II